jgi:hypothetical protein
MEREPVTYLSEDNASIFEFYNNIRSNSKNTYNMDYLLRTLTKINEYGDEQNTNQQENENLETMDHTLDVEDSDYFSDEELSTFRIHYDDSEEEDEAEDAVEETTPMVETV